MSENNLSVGTYSLYNKISTYLPDDDYSYEVCLSLRFTSKSNNYTDIVFTNDFASEPFFSGDSYSTSNAEVKSAYGYYVIGPRRVFNMEIVHTAAQALTITATRYRRLGSIIKD